MSITCAKLKDLEQGRSYRFSEIFPFVLIEFCSREVIVYMSHTSLLKTLNLCEAIFEIYNTDTLASVKKSYAKIEQTILGQSEAASK